jgi:hypothetical protein
MLGHDLWWVWVYKTKEKVIMGVWWKVFSTHFQKRSSTFVHQMAWSWVWGVKFEIKSEHKRSLLLFGDGFFWSLLSKCSMFDNRVHIDCTWKDMSSQGNVVFFQTPSPPFGEGGWVETYFTCFKTKCNYVKWLGGAKCKTI